MKKTIRIILPIFLALCIILCTAWYLFIYDRAFTRDVLLSFARYNDDRGNHKVATWFYNHAYSQAGDNDAVAIELAEQYKAIGNYTKAEFTLSNAIADGGGVNLYVALCKTYVEQDKLLDAVNMLDSVTNPDVKAKLDAMRPLPPTSAPTPGFYSQYISVTLEGSGGTLYATNDGQYPSTADTPYQAPIPLHDGENTIYAVTVADSGLVSPLSIFGYTVGGVISKMEFADQTMEAEIRSILGVTAEKELFTNDLWSIHEFTMPQKVTNYSDLQHMIFLETLTIENGKAGQLSSLSNLVNLSSLTIRNTKVSQQELGTIAALPKLKNLTLTSCSISGITPLQKATGLVTLDLSGNGALRNIDALQGMTGLQELSLEGNAVADLKVLAQLTNLTKLDVSSNNLSTLVPINTLTRLNWLDAGTNAITNLGEINKLSALSYLDLSDNKLTNVNALSGCTTLTKLNISNNSLSDISKLNALTNLEDLDFSYNEVKKIPSFPKDSQLTVITGSNNKISSLEPLSGLKHLNIVNMDYNASISSVKPLASCHSLIKVNVYGTKVTKVSSLTEQSIIVNYNPVK